MGCLVEAMFFKKGVDKIDKKTIPNVLWNIEINDIEGNNKKLSDYSKDKKALLFVNVACKWGLTSDNYLQLVDLHNKYKDKGFSVLGFPCGQFMNQEFDSQKEIKEFVQEKFKVDFPMFSKIEVNGENTHPIYKYLKENSQDMKT